MNDQLLFGQPVNTKQHNLFQYQGLDPNLECVEMLSSQEYAVHIFL